MGPAEIVQTLRELCDKRGPRITTADIVRWIEARDGYETEAELIAYAKKMKARQYARMLYHDDEETGRRVRRLWSVRDRATGRRYYMDLLGMPASRRKRLIDEYAKMVEQQRTIRRAMSDFFAGQQFFDFYNESIDAVPSPDASEAGEESEETVAVPF